MPGARFASADEVSLYTVEMADAEFVRTYSNHPELRGPMTLDGPRNLERVEDQITGETDHGVQFLACVEGDSVGFEPENVLRGADAPTGVDAVEPIGVVMLFAIDEREGNARFAHWLTPDVHGEGFATEATALALEYAFGHRRLRRVNARALATNAPSNGLLEKLGFTHEGTQREEKFVDGDTVDTHVYGLLADEWERARDELDVELDD